MQDEKWNHGTRSLLSGLVGLAIGMIVMAVHNEKYFLTKYNYRYDHFATLDDDEIPNSPYSHVQTLGFNVYTGGAPAWLNATYDSNNMILNAGPMNPECKGHQAFGVLGGWEFECYVGNDNATVDVHQRLTIMRQAIERAYEVSSKDRSTLKIFMAPEFYWRGVDGAYIFEESSGCGTVCPILEGLEKIVEDERFQDWFFVFGTIISSKILPQNRSDNLFYNFAPIYRGFDPSVATHHGKRFILPKRYVSKIDFLTPQRHLDPNHVKELVDEPLPADDMTIQNPIDFHRFQYDNLWKDYKNSLGVRGYNMIEYGWIVVDGITMSIEICYDHKKRSALATYLADLASGSTIRIPSIGANTPNGLSYVPIPTHQAQVSLVASAGMQIQAEALVLTNNGTIFLQDGLSDERSVMFSSGNLSTFDFKLNFDGGVEAVQRVGVLTDTDVFFEYRLIEDITTYSIYEGMQSWKQALNGTFATTEYEPKIAVYKPIPIAS